MRFRKHHRLVLLLAVLAALNGGCIDLVTDGVKDGVNDAISGAVTDAILSVFGSDGDR